MFLPTLILKRSLYSESDDASVQSGGGASVHNGGPTEHMLLENSEGLLSKFRVV